ncbi:hypothetical protein RJ639_042792 [Escallonia herrerae]|uniref:RWP-RK domain-containing protein n=1 Tax=Escallonia herrerae TaxID=1293975 RepID=A0AA88WC96_9ASTE|nr:hypothetical protein RJ639_042792 [Escallonia herrerae]
MAPPHSHSLKALVVFKHLMYPALIRTVHVYRSEEGVEEEVEEREYVFHKEGDYEEIGFCKIHQKVPIEEVSEENNDNEHELKKNEDRFGLDLNSVPYMDSEDEESNQSAPVHIIQIPAVNNTYLAKLGGQAHAIRDVPKSKSVRVEVHVKTGMHVRKKGIVERKKRAAPKDIARLALEDLAKYFDLPIAEGSKNLKVGLTVLKKKCREFGIPRWPHRKIKSLDGLIRDLQEEVKRQQEADKAAATVVAKR